MKKDIVYKKEIKKVAKGAGVTFTGDIFGKGLFFASQVIIARFFGTDVFGLYVLGLTVLKIVDILSRFGLPAGAMRFVSMYHQKNLEKVKGILISSLSISFLNGIIMGAFLYFAAGAIAELIFHKPGLKEMIQTFAFCAPFMGSMMVAATASQGFHTSKYAVYIKDFIQPSINLLLIFVFISLGLGLSGVIYAFIISYVVAFLMGINLLIKIFPSLKDRTLKPAYEIKNLVIYSIPLIFSQILYFLLSWTDIIILGYLKTPQDVGIYRAASQMPLFLPTILYAFNSIYAPLIADLFYRKEWAKMEKIFKTTTRWIFSFSLPISLIFIFSAKDLLSIFGHGFIEKGTPVLIILTIAQLINCAAGGAGFTLTMTGRQKMEFLNSFSLVISSIILNLLLIPKYGVIGASIATGISIAAINLLRLLEVYVIYKMHPYDKGYLKGVVSSIIAGLILLLFNKSFPTLPTGFSFLVNSFIVGVIFIGFLRLHGISNEDRYIMDTIKTKFADIFAKRA